MLAPSEVELDGWTGRDITELLWLLFVNQFFVQSKSLWQFHPPCLRPITRSMKSLLRQSQLISAENEARTLLEIGVKPEGAVALTMFHARVTHCVAGQMKLMPGGVW